MGRQISEQKTINGNTFTMTKLPATRALVELTKLMNLLGPSLAALASSKKDAEGAGAEEAILPAIGELFGRLKESEVRSLLQTYLTQCTVMRDGKEVEVYPIIDTDLFHGRVSDLIKLLAWCIACNFADFFEGSGGLGAALRKVVKEKSATLNTFSGPSGASS